MVFLTYCQSSVEAMLSWMGCTGNGVKGTCLRICLKCSFQQILTAFFSFGGSRQHLAVSWCSFGYVCLDNIEESKHVRAVSELLRQIKQGIENKGYFQNFAKRKLLKELSGSDYICGGNRQATLQVWILPQTRAKTSPVHFLYRCCLTGWVPSPLYVLLKILTSVVPCVSTLKLLFWTCSGIWLKLFELNVETNRLVLQLNYCIST